MVNKKDIGLKYIFLQVMILVLIATIPMYFYVNSEIKNKTLQDNIQLQHYAIKVANKIYEFSNSNAKEFYFPRSNIFKSAIYDLNNKVIFSLLDKKHKRYLKYKLKDNIFNASYLIVAKKISYTKLILNSLIILVIIILLVFLSSFFIIQQVKESYQKLNLHFENFIKDAMHELKTPIGVILLNLDGLNLIYSNNKMIKRAKSALKNMIVVYEDLEFFVMKNKISHPKIEINLSLLCAERVEFFMDLLNSKNMNINLEIQKDLKMEFSKLEISRIIDNTISNAIKYSKNETSIFLKLYKHKSNIILEIKDEGKGIKDINEIFNRYYRGDKISGGFGIGLNIVKNICDKNDVSIDVKSTQNIGSIFKYTFILKNL